MKPGTAAGKGADVTAEREGFRIDKAIEAHLAERVRAARASRGMTQAEFARLLDVSPQQIQRYEQAVHRIPIATLLRIAAIFGLPVGHFYEGLPVAGAGAPSAAGLGAAARVRAAPGPSQREMDFIRSCRGVAPAALEELLMTLENAALSQAATAKRHASARSAAVPPQEVSIDAVVEWLHGIGRAAVPTRKPGEYLYDGIQPVSAGHLVRRANRLRRNRGLPVFLLRED